MKKYVYFLYIIFPVLSVFLIATSFASELSISIAHKNNIEINNGVQNKKIVLTFQSMDM